MPAAAPPPMVNQLAPPIQIPGTVAPPVARPTPSVPMAGPQVDTVQMQRQQQASAKEDSDTLAYNLQQIESLQLMKRGGVISPALDAEINRLQREAQSIMARHPNWPAPKGAASWMR